MRVMIRLALGVLALSMAVPAYADVDLFGLRPGMTLPELLALPAPGVEKFKKRRYGCLNEPAVQGKMIEVMESSVVRETALGIVTCLAIEPDTLNTSYWSMARVNLEGATGALWLPFVAQPSGPPKLAMIAFYPFQKRDEAAVGKMLASKLGAGTPTKREVKMLGSGSPMDVTTWPSAGATLDATADRSLYLYRPELTQDLGARLAKIPGGSFFFGVPN